MIARITVTDENRDNVLNFIKINHPNYVLVDNYEVIDREKRYFSDKAFETQGIEGPAVIVEMEGDLSIKIKKEDYAKKGNKLIPLYLSENDFVDVFPAYNEYLRELKGIQPCEKVVSFKNFEVRNGQVVKREPNLRSGETVFIVR